MPHNTGHDLSGHRRESTTRQRGLGPLFSCTPLPSNRERKPQVQPTKRRRRPTPPTPALTYDPRNRRIPNGNCFTSASLPISSESATSETLENAHEQQPTSFGDREMPTHIHDEYDPQGWSHISDHSAGQSISSCTDASYENDMSQAAPDPYDSPESYTSSSSPAPSDQSPRAADFTVSGVDYVPPAQPSMPMCPYDAQGYVAVPQGSYGFPMDAYADQHMQGYPVQYVEPTCGRPGMHGGPPCPGSDGYQYSNPRRS